MILPDVPDEVIARIHAEHEAMADGGMSLVGPLGSRSPEEQRERSVPELLRDVGVDAINAEMELPAVEAALRRLPEQLVDADEVRVAMVRSAVLARLQAAKIAAPAKILEAVLGRVKTLRAMAAVERMAADAEAERTAQRWPEPVDGAELLDDVMAVFQRYLVLPDGGAEALALWVLFSYAHDAFAISPIVALTSPSKQCGKTHACTVLAAMVPRPLFTSNVSSAAVFRCVDAFAPTLLVDELDSFLTTRAEIRGLLNSGHRREGAVVIRVIGGKPQRFSTWCPKVLSLIGKLPPTLADRSIELRMRRRMPTEPVAELHSERVVAELEPLRRRMARWRDDHFTALREADPSVPATLQNRGADNWKRLLAIADLAGGPWLERARAAAVALSSAVMDEEAAIQLLADLRSLFAERGVTRLASSEIVQVLGRREDRPWPEWKHGRPLTVRQLALLLAPFGVRPTQFKLGGQKVRGYEVGDLSDAFARYLPGLDAVPVVRSSSGAQQSASTDPVPAVPHGEPPEKSHSRLPVPVVPDATGAR